MNILKKTVLYTGALLKRDRGSKILYYHDVYSKNCYCTMGTPLALFEEHLNEIRSFGFHIVREINAPTDQVQLCFDDGFLGVWDTLDFFRENQLCPTVFCAVDLLEKSGYLNSMQLRHLLKENWRVQSHTWSHCDLTGFHGEALHHEMSDAKKELERLLESPIDELCFPIGYYSDEVLAAGRAAKYTKMYSSVPGNFADELMPGVIRRNLVQHFSAKEIRQVLAGGLNPFAEHYRRLHLRNSRV